MNEDLYCVVLTGKLVAGRDTQSTKQALAGLFKTSQESIDELLAKAPVKIKKEIDRDTGLKYKAAVEQAGALCELQKLKPAAEAPALAPLASTETYQPSLPREEPKPGSEGASERDVYAPPEAPLDPEAGAGSMDLIEPRRVAAGRGWAWIAEGFSYFAQSPGPWIGAAVVWALMIMVLNFIPFAFPILQPLFVGGVMLGCLNQDRGDGFEFRHLFSGFSHQAGKLAILGVVKLAAIIVFVLVVGIASAVMIPFMAGGTLQDIAQAEGQGQPPEAMLPMLILMFAMGVLALTGGLLIYMATWFSEVLIVAHEVDVMESIRLSLRGTLRNWVPFLVVYPAILFVLAIFASLPFGLGWLVLGPVLMGSIFAAYKDIFTA